MAFMLGKSYDGVFNLGCGATLISPTAVVSAAHCFEFQVTLPDNTVVYAAGWGDTKPGEPSHSAILQHVAVDVINYEICVKRHAILKERPEGWFDVTPETLCTGILDVGGKDACTGHSVGPVIHNEDVLVGITSWGYGCAHPTYPGINVRVSSYADWINKTSIA